MASSKIGKLRFFLTKVQFCSQYLFKIVLQVVNKFADTKIQEEIKHSRNHDTVGPIQLKLSHLSGAFILWAFGLGFSLLVFILEIFYFNSRKSCFSSKKLAKNAQKPETVINCQFLD